MASDKKAVDKPPAGMEPLMMSMKMMDSYGLKTGPALKDTVAFKIFEKDFVMKEIIDLGFYSAFHPHRKILEKYPLPQILVLADYEEQYGENWLLCTTEDAFRGKIEEMDKVRRDEEEGRARAEAEAEAARIAREEEERRVYEVLPLVARPYSSATAAATDAEVLRLSTQPSRQPVRARFMRKRSEFGRRYTFSDKDVDGNAWEFRPRRAPEYALVRTELDVALQDCPGTISGSATSATQTLWHRLVSDSCQTDPIAVSDVAMSQDIDSQIQSFLSKVLPVCEHALQQNETLNIFQNELLLLDEEDSMLVGAQGENAVKTLVNFMDLVYSNNKNLVWLDWHPTNRSWIATSVVSDLVFDSRVENSGRATVSYIVVYSFAEFSAQIVLEAPLDVFCFKWNPWASHLIAAGCSSGQVLLYDLTDAMAAIHKAKVKPAGKGAKAAVGGAGSGGDQGSLSSQVDSKLEKCIHVKHKYMSTIDHSHTRQVADLKWLPPTHHLTARGKFEAMTDGKSYQFMSGAPDGFLLVWDVRFEDKLGGVGGGRRNSVQPSGVSASATTPTPPTDVPWAPTYKVLIKASGQGKCGVVRFALNSEVPSDPVYCTTDEGTFVVADWAPAGQGTGYDKAMPGGSSGAGSGAGAAAGAGGEGEGGGGAAAEEGGEMGGYRVLWSSPDHARATKALERSPFFSDLLLSVGEFSFTLWRQDLSQPLFRSPPSLSLSPSPITCGRWSPTRPGVVFIGKYDGTIDVWDLVDQTNKPSLTKSVVSLPVTCLGFRDPALSKHQQFLAVGDAKGNLHIMDIPVSLRKSSTAELGLMSAYIEREKARVAYYNRRGVIRGEELVAKEAAAEARERAEAAVAAAREAEVQAATANLGEGELLDLAKLDREKARRKLEREEADFQQLERSVMAELGLNPDTFVVPVPVGDVFEDDLEEEKRKKAAGGGDPKRRMSGTVSMDGIDLEVK